MAPSLLRLRRPARPSALTSVIAALPLALALTTACTGTDPFAPGEPLGTFHVKGTLTSSTCGEVPDPWSFDVRLRHEAETIYWVQGGLPIAGTLDTTARVVLEATETRTTREADEARGTSACTLSRTDVVDMILAPVTPAAPVTTTSSTEPAATSASSGATSSATTGRAAGATSFTGTLSYTFAAAGACDDQLTASGGDFATLPCTVRYALEGTRAR